MKIALLGDVALFGKYSVKNQEIFNYFKDIANTLKEFDYVVCNLETPFCDLSKPYGHKSAYISATEENIKILKYLNINIVNLSNNHIFDYGLEGYENTKRLLKENDIEYFGIENKQIKIEKDDAKVALSGFCCYSTNALGYYKPKAKVGVNVLNAFEVEKVLINNYKEGYFNIASFHVGQEHINYPNYDHILMARIFAQKVPYVFYGHHPHVIQGVENVKDSLIAYSLGNFCFDDVYTDKSKNPLIEQSEENKKAIILSLEISDNKVIKYKTIPIYNDINCLEVGKCDYIIRDLNVYSKLLAIDEKEYINKRRNLLDEFIIIRKRKRNFMWYIKRLNFNSVGIILNAKSNQKKYIKYITNYIDKYKCYL